MSDGDSRQYGDTSSDPYIVADCHRFGPFIAGVALLGVERMAGGENTDVGPDENMVADRHRSLVEYGQVEVDECVVSDRDVASPVAAHRLIDLHAFAALGEKSPEQSHAAVDVVGRHVVEPAHNKLGFAQAFLKLWHGCAIALACDHFVQLCQERIHDLWLLETVDVSELDVKHQYRIRQDYAGRLDSVALVGRDDYTTAVAYTHVGECYLPSADHVGRAEAVDAVAVGGHSER